MTGPSSKDDLRKRAESRVDREGDEVGVLSPDQMRAVVHELRTHQIELELQNEDLRASQEALAEARDRFVHLYDFGPVGYVTLDPRGRVLEANLTFARMVGADRDDLIGGTLSERAWEPEDADAIWRHCRTLGRGDGGEPCEVRLRRGDERFWVRLESERSEDPESGEVLIRTAVIDVTERRAAEEERRRVEQQMFRAQKLESLGVLAGGIAHDFNNLLTVILGHTSLILSDAQPGSSSHASAESIREASQHAADLCRQMLTYARGDTSQIEPLDLSRLVHDMARLMSVSISKNVELELQLDDAPPVIEADAAKLRQVVMNLVTNASEAIGEESGRITVSTRVAAHALAETDEAVGDPAALERGRVCLEVTDTGSGIDAETRARIFDPFFSTRFPGRGLGLSSVLGIVRAHGGYIGVRSEEGRGTTFRVFLPASAESAHAEPVDVHAAPVTKLRGTVLVVEDERLVRDYAVRVLTHAGCEVLTATNGLEAMEVFRERGDDIDVVLLDRTMPGLGGEATLQRLRTLRPDLRVVLVSGYGEPSFYALAGQAGDRRTPFLQKPYHPKELLDALRDLACE